MKIYKIMPSVVAVSLLALGLVGPIVAFAATTPPLGTAATYGVLSSTYTDTSAATTITGDVGFTTPPATAPAGVHANYGSGAPYATAGIDQGAALSALSSQACTFTFAPGAINLSTDTTHGPIGVYTPGVYCSAGAMNVGGPLTLSGGGTYIFRPVGALTSTAGAVVTLAGASSCDVFWTPSAATTLAANTTFVGTVIDNAGITVGANTTWTGRALAFGGTVTTATDTINVPSCAPSTAILRVEKSVVGGVAIPSSFSISVKNGGVDVSGSPAAGAVTPGTSYTLTAGTYVISETANPSYTTVFGGDCAANGSVSLVAGDNKLCTVVNTDNSVLPPSGGGAYYNAPLPLINVTKIPSPLNLPGGAGSVTYTYTVTNLGIVPMRGVWVKDDKCVDVKFVSGDTNSDSQLDTTESWIYTCSKTLAKTETNTVTAHGQANGWDGYDIANATVVVGAPIVPPLINVIKKPSVFVLPAGGGAVTYTYTVTNPGIVPLSDVSITDNKCTGLPGRVVGHPGDLNKNNLLENNETWTFTCQTNITQTTTNIGTAVGHANGLIAIDLSPATVAVAAPSLPNTGFSGDSQNIVMLALSLSLLLVSASLLFVLKKGKN